MSKVKKYFRKKAIEFLLFLLRKLLPDWMNTVVPLSEIYSDVPENLDIPVTEWTFWIYQEKEDEVLEFLDNKE
jgi:hypothetical protein